MRFSPLVSAFLVGIFTTLVVGASAAPTSDAPKASVVQRDDAETRWAPSKKAEIRMLALGENAFLGHLSMQPGAAVPEHRDASEEYIYVLQGSGRITIDDQVHDVSPGTGIFMPTNAKVSFQNLAYVHPRWNPKWIQDDVNCRPILHVRHVFHRDDS